MKTILLLITALLLLAHPGFATTYSYDALNRLSHVGYDNGNSVDCSYDTGGNITKVARLLTAYAVTAVAQHLLLRHHQISAQVARPAVVVCGIGIVSAPAIRQIVRPLSKSTP